MNYDYKDGKKRVLDIINDSNRIEEVSKIPEDKDFSFENGYYSRVSSIFIDIRDSTTLFAENKKSSTAKIVRAFSSEIIGILRDDGNLREIGIRGDCVYAIYAANKVKHNIEIMEKAIFIRTYLIMLNKLLEDKKMKTIKAGIGISTHEDLVIKAGRKGKDKNVNSKVWIGQAVTYASKLSNLANKGELEPILITSEFYNYIIEKFKEENTNYDSSWFTKRNDTKIGAYYGTSLYKSQFKEWIDGGMK